MRVFNLGRQRNADSATERVHLTLLRIAAIKKTNSSQGGQKRKEEA